MEAEILRGEGQGGERALWEVAWAKRQREMDIWETRCWVALLQVYWERVEEGGRRAVGVMQWRPNKIVLRQHQRNWDRGWLQFRAQEGAAKLWVREGVQGLEIACWHIRCWNTILDRWYLAWWGWYLAYQGAGTPC